MGKVPIAIRLALTSFIGILSANRRLGSEEFLTRQASKPMIKAPTREQSAKFDKKRRNKSSNKDWQHDQ